jgi:hypothetical protein
MKPLDDILTKHGFIKRKTDNNYQSIEDALGFQLPDDYKYYLNNYDGFENSIGEEYVRLWQFDELMESNEGYEIFELPNIMAIGGNGGGEFIGIEFLDENTYRLILAPFIGMDESEYYIEIGTSFTDMLTRLDKGQAWFD